MFPLEHDDCQDLDRRAGLILGLLSLTVVRFRNENPAFRYFCGTIGNRSRSIRSAHP